MRESQRRRFKPVEWVDDVIEKDTAWRVLRGQIDDKKKEANVIQKAIASKKKAKEDADEEIMARKVIMSEVGVMEEELATLALARDSILNRIGNLVHESVPVAEDEDHNAVVGEWGELAVPEVTVIKHHHELLRMIGGYDPERGVKVANHRGYFLTGPGVLLNQALINYSLAFLGARGYMPMQTPYFMLKNQMSRTAQLEDFDEALYKVVGEEGEGEANASYLIATSEQPISAFHADEWIQEGDLPIKYAGYSTNFRKEAGSHGKDAWGIFRVHQFEKIEQFVLCKPEDSWDLMESMKDIACEFYQSLGLPYRVVAIVSAELNNAAAKKYDIEGWYPTLGTFRELVSCSNCTDYQARSLEVRCGAKKKGDKTKKYVHMLNSTLCATTRVICAILENYQTNDGIRIPEALQPFLGGMDFIPFIMDMPKRPKQKGKKKKKGGN